MRINFNLDTSRINNQEFNPPDWFRNQIDAFLEEWDLNPESGDVSNWFVDRKKGLPEFVKWLRANDWAANYYEMDHKYYGEIPLSFGIEFKEDCPRFVEAKLKT